ncbi:MAG TPA: sigma-70 family RNA polymerase sigma factor, partial [Chloroflexota bacterium]|nr:sigma-70 family RNA polymerase sigma factor [Chloroflexota bacterium]
MGCAHPALTCRPHRDTTIDPGGQFSSRAYMCSTSSDYSDACATEIVVVPPTFLERVVPQQEFAAWIARARVLDEDAWDQLYQSAFPQVYRYVASKVNGVPEAEDITEEVFVGALQTVSGLRATEEASFLAWLFQIARNKVADHLRRQYRRPTEPLDPEAEIGDPSPTPEEAALRADDVRSVRAALAELSAEQREVIVMKFALGYDNARAAAVLGKSSGAINQLQHRALQALGRVLDRVKA